MQIRPEDIGKKVVAVTSGEYETYTERFFLCPRDFEKNEFEKIAEECRTGVEYYYEWHDCMESRLLKRACKPIEESFGAHVPWYVADMRVWGK